MTGGVRLPCSDMAVKATTGRDWSEWRAALDAKHAMELTHRELAALIGGMHDAGGWWSQTVAVGYARLCGKRVVGQKAGGGFAANASKTLPLAAAEAHAWFADAGRRKRWLPDPITVRTSTPPKSLRMTWADETSVQVWITEKGTEKSTVAVQHSKLPDQAAVGAAKLFWRAALQRLATVASEELLG
jgi:hypothetical protein